MTATPDKLTLRRFARPRPVAGGVPGSTPGDRCELCGERVGERHPHLVDPRRRSIACACLACALLFTRPGGRYRTVPDRVLTDPGAPLTGAEWAELRIPVGLAFFFRNSALGQLVASYPSPAGVTECELDLAAWDRLAARHPLLRAMTPDVEAILVASGAGPQVPGGTGALVATGTAASNGGGVEAFLVPIDVCYSLAGALRRQWQGFDGGDAGRQVITELLASLRDRARPVDQAQSMNGTEV